MSGCAHEDCRRLSGWPTLCLHQATLHYSVTAGVADAIAVAHRHRWVFDTAWGGWAVYHCDEHDPPVVRKVWLEGVTL